jgi:hypothetical protein
MLSHHLKRSNQLSQQHNSTEFLFSTLSLHFRTLLVANSTLMENAAASIFPFLLGAVIILTPAKAYFSLYCDLTTFIIHLKLSTSEPFYWGIVVNETTWFFVNFMMHGIRFFVFHKMYLIFEKISICAQQMSQPIISSSAVGNYISYVFKATVRGQWLIIKSFK